MFQESCWLIKKNRSTTHPTLVSDPKVLCCSSWTNSRGKSLCPWVRDINILITTLWDNSFSLVSSWCSVSSFIWSVQNVVQYVSGHQTQWPIWQVKLKCLWHITYCMCLCSLLVRPGSTPNNLENPIRVTRFFSSGCHDNCAFYFWLLWNSERERERSQIPQRYVRRCAPFQTGVSCWRELKVIN